MIKSRIAKTMKREVAICGLLFWGVIVARTFWAVPIDQVSAFVPLLEAITWPVWAYAAGAFGLDAWNKQRPTAVPYYEGAQD